MLEKIKEFTFETGSLRWFDIGEGEPLVLLHGWSMSHVVFSEIAEILAADFRLLIPDLPGHGRSATPETCSLKEISRVLYSWIDSLALSSLNLLGWSLGGQAALSLAHSYPQLVKRLVLISTTPRFCACDNWTAGLPSQELRALRRRLLRDFQPTLRDFFDLQFDGEDLSVERRRAILKFAVSVSGLPKPQAAVETLDILAQEDLREILPDICQETLVIHGEDDKIIPLAAGQYLAEHLRLARLLQIPGTGHAPFLSQPQSVAEQIRTFCR